MNMDGSETNRKSTGAIRKRRSSILKSQRQSRAPLSELEFYVATPTDTAKSRRVSFSRRTGVAEFVTNEATTTWKNFYEEHNKSLESSNNDSQVNQRQTMGHLGNRVFDDQFQVVEIDLVNTLSHSSNRHGNISNDNYADQLATLESGSNFSAAVQPDINVIDDLDEIEKDILKNQLDFSNVVCSGPLEERSNTSQYIEVDLNMTHMPVGNGMESDMSITDTISSPNLQPSHSKRSIQLGNDAAKSTDWIVDKENILLVNPYVAPPETDNFAINEASDKFLVFDGKRLTLQSEKNNLHSNVDENNANKLSFTNALANNSQNVGCQRKTLVLNVDDDLPNFIDSGGELESNINSQKSNVSVVEKRQTIVYDDGELSMTEAVNNLEIQKQNTFCPKMSDHDMSLTTAAPGNVVFESQIVRSNIRNVMNSKSEGNISITEAVQFNKILDNDNERSYACEKDCDISMTQAVPAKIISYLLQSDTAKRQTIIFDNDDGNISVTQAVPSGVIPVVASENSDNNKTVLYEKPSNISMTEVVPSNIIFTGNTVAHPKESATIMYDDNHDLSITLSVPTSDVNKKDSINTSLNNNYHEDKTVTKGENDGTVNLSFTRIIPNNIIIDMIPEKRKTVVFDNDEGNMSLTQALSNMVRPILPKEEKRQTLSQPVDISMTVAISNNIIEEAHNNIQTTCNEVDADMSVTRAVSPASQANNLPKRGTIVYEDSCHLSMTKPIPTTLLEKQKETAECEITYEKLSSSLLHQRYTNDVVVYQAADASNVGEQKEVNTYEKNISLDANIYTKGTQEDLIDSDQIKDKESNNFGENQLKPNISYQLYSQENSQSSNINLFSAVNPQKSILNDLLDMSNASLVDGIEDKNITAQLESNDRIIDLPKDEQSESSKESFFYIIRDCHKDAQTDENYEALTTLNNVLISPTKKQSEPRKSLTFADDVHEIRDENFLPKSKDNNKHSLEKNIISPSNKQLHNEEESSDLNIINDKVIVKNSDHNNSHQVEDCDNTQNLLDMLTNFTESPLSKASLDDNGDDAIKINGTKQIVVEKISENNDRLSVVAHRKSIVFTKDDVNNRSIEQSLLLKSKIEIEDCDPEVEMADTSIEHNLPHKRAFIKTDAVKTLHFDESASEESIRPEVHNLYPIKKTFDETSYGTESKAKVIPSYMSDVADNIKDLMRDLVKPMADVLPFDSPEKSSACKCTTQIQADLITSSQVDLETLSSAVSYDFEKMSRSTQALHTSKPSAIPTQSSFDGEGDRRIDYDQDRQPQSAGDKEQVISFDPENPLNNVVLMPIDDREGHKYNPPSSFNSKSSIDNLTKHYDTSKDRIPLSYRVENVHTVTHNTSESVKLASPSSTCNLSKRTSVDCGVDVRCVDVKNVDCNTLIAMKDNRQLLDASSSLTLVDDALQQRTIADDIDCQSSVSHNIYAAQIISNSPLDAVFKTDKQNSTTDMELDIDHEEIDNCRTNTKVNKRSYSPSKREPSMLPDVDVTPKPACKVTRLSNSPNAFQNERVYDNTERNPVDLRDPEPIEVSDDEAPAQTLQENKRKPLKRTSKSNSKEKNPCTSITVQHLITEFNMNDDLDERNLTQEVMTVLVEESPPSSQSGVSSCTSSKNQSEMELQRARPAGVPRPLPCESGANVVADIDMLSFMGTAECEWESSGGDWWSFRLLRARVRLRVQLAHRHHNAPRSFVRADTPLRQLHIHLIRKDENPVGRACVQFALETMRVCAARLGWRATDAAGECRARDATDAAGELRAGDVVRVLRACAAAARLAMRWGRAMGVARLRLAYKLHEDGQLSLTVANIPLRSVWEVSLRTALEVPPAPAAPWPRACDVRVVAVVARATPAPCELAALLDTVPHDWGHVPRVLWKIFNYLKNKSQEDMLPL